MSSNWDNWLQWKSNLKVTKIKKKTRSQSWRSITIQVRHLQSALVSYLLGSIYRVSLVAIRFLFKFGHSFLFNNNYMIYLKKSQSTFQNFELGPQWEIWWVACDSRVASFETSVSCLIDIMKTKWWKTKTWKLNAES